MYSIKGIVPIAAAPFTKSGLVDEDSFQNMVRHLVKTGIQGITLFGLATEFYKLTDDERSRMMQILLAETEKHPEIASMISITDHSLEIASERAKNAEDMGANSLMLLPPYFLQPSEEAIFEHIAAVATAVNIPIVVQYAPAQTGVRIAPDTFIRLREKYEQIQYVKVETQPPGRYISELISGSKGRLQALVGYAGIQMPDVLSREAAGIQPGCSFSEIYVELYQLYTSAQTEKFENLFSRLLPYISYWMQGVELIVKAEKTILQKRGIIESNYCRKPNYSLDQKEVEMIDQFLEEFKEFC
ncbi:dihydrodipicolinate synthase family protein [Ammoniphilus resinae]|uniref:4-hydroxy-tetrahydrodipicolinate synthase n=1 Tax=Ammoniphilus resinae TaxID=861532 RepID=A0ABS4GVD7_9BACL|nr:dihydrodipicolinate synthase family protein [Ammoniphilus resinae]MBP1934214.1 4-hydroxy-tetrahydrodipicolinate synthase [Ammoniphilus resinae]